LIGLFFRWPQYGFSFLQAWISGIDTGKIKNIGNPVDAQITVVLENIFYKKILFVFLRASVIGAFYGFGKTLSRGSSGAESVNIGSHRLGRRHLHRGAAIRHEGSNTKQSGEKYFFHREILIPV